MAPTLVLKYFDVSARGEAARLLLELGGVPFTDEMMSFADWPAYKSSTPFGQAPCLEVDGGKVLLAQSGAINRYCAKLAKLYPEDFLEAAFVDMIVCQSDDCIEPIYATNTIKDNDAKLLARAEVVKGVVSGRMTKLGEYLESLKTPFFGGSTPNFADVITFANNSFMQSGFLEGIPLDVLSAFPVLKAHHARMANFPAIATYYKTKNNPKRIGFTADAA
ncbi:MAG: hypothetical protein WDW38_005464 [Sanguina aurantia]